ncbi:MAG: hypothetical protein JKX92_13020 [Porticoccaceae bacterium]|nr:hypothetical protein [Porticoccaceae bacterium]
MAIIFIFGGEAANGRPPDWHQAAAVYLKCWQSGREDLLGLSRASDLAQRRK